MVTSILDGRALARSHEPALTARARTVSRARGRPPGLFLMAFTGPDGRVPHVAAKLRAGERVGIGMRTVAAPAGADEAQILRLLEDGVREAQADGVFVQVPFPPGIDGGAVTKAIPTLADIDVMSPAACRSYLEGRSDSPPITVAATLRLLDAHGRAVEGRTATVVGPASSFNHMFVEALVRRGARATLLEPHAPDRAARLTTSDLVVVSAARPGLVSSTELPPGCIAVDAGYFNPAGRGDLDVSGGVSHLAALAPVPGGVGPMTIAALVEAVIERAERTVPRGSTTGSA